MKTNARLVAAALALVAASCEKPATQQLPPPVVEVMELTAQKVARSTTFVGQLDSPQNVDVRARVESFLEKMLFEEGSLVEQNAPLFLLDKKPFEERLAAAKGELDRAKAALGKSKQDVERLTPLVAAKAVPKKDLDDATSATEANEAAVASAEANVKSAELNLGYCDIRAPLAGRIGAKQVDVGSLVGKGEPTLLVTISQVDPIWFYCSISEVDYLQADRIAREAGRKMGELPVHLILADGTEHSAAGKWIFIDRIVDPTTATIRTRAEFPNPDKNLRPGMFARVRVSLAGDADDVLVPERALTELQGKYFLWVVGADGKASQRPVEVAPNRIGPNAVVLSGVKPGEKIVVEGVHKLREGAPVQAKPFSPPAEKLAPAPAATPAAKPATK